MQKMHLTKIFSTIFLGVFLTANCVIHTSAWSNGGYSTDQFAPEYGTHDWIAQHAVDWLPAQEKQFFIDNLASYLYGTELPDNRNTPEGVGDTTKHHIYFYANHTLQDDASANRAAEEYTKARQLFEAENYSGAAVHLGMMTHYISDMAVFGHTMGTTTMWDAEKHHNDYESYVLTRTRSYISEFDGYLSYDGNLEITSAYDAALMVAYDTTFDPKGIQSCVWMDTNYNWSDPDFKNRCGESLNFATNIIADVLYTFSTTKTIPELSTKFVGITLILTITTISTCIHIKNYYYNKKNKKA